MKKILFLLLAAIMSLSQLLAQTVPITIGTGTTTTQAVPFHHYYDYSHAQMLYLSSELVAGQVDSISFYYDLTTPKTMSSATVYLGEVSRDRMARYGYVPADSLTVVYQGSLSFSEGWVTIHFTTPFTYSGVGNLVVGFTNGHGEYNDLSGSKFRCTATSDTLSVVGYRDNTAVTVSNVSTATNQSAYAYRPNIIFHLLPDGEYCNPVEGLAVSDITTNSASLSWTSDVSNFEYEYKPTSDSWTSENVVSGTLTTPNISLSDLLPGTNYDFRVKNICSSGESFYTTISFQTLCDVISEFPWIEGFESTWNSQNLMSNTIAAPFCWYNINAGGSTYNWQQTSSTVYEGSKAAYMYCYSSTSSTSSTYKNDDWFITPVFELTGSEVLSFYTKKSSSSYTPELRIYAFSLENGDISSAADTASFFAIDSLADLTADYAEREVSLESLVGQYRLAFVRNKTYANGSVYIDNVSVKAAPPCQRPSDLVVLGRTDSEISVSWTEVEGASSYNVYYRTDDDEPWTTVNVASNEYTITELTSATEYTIDVTAICSEGTETGFTFAPSVVTATLCAPYPVPFTEDFTTFPATTSITSCWQKAKGFTNEALVYGSSSWGSQTKEGILLGSQHAKINIYKTSATLTDKKEWLITPTIDLGDGSTEYDLKFSLAFTKNNSTDAPVGCVGQKFMALISQDGGTTWDSINNLTWEPAFEGQETNDLSSVSTSGQIVKVNLTELGYTGNIRVGFYAYQTQYVAGQDNDLHIDDVQIIEHVECPDLLTVDVNVVTTTSVALDWDNTADTGDGWIVLYTEGTTITSDTEDAQTVNVPNGTELPYVLEGLTPGTTYSFIVSYDCGGAWTTPSTITLPASAAEVPYTCDFEDEDENASWTLINGTAATKWFIGAETASPENNKLYVSSDNGATLSYEVSGKKTLYAIRTIAFDEAPLYRITFDYKGGGESTYDFVKVGLWGLDQTFEAGTTLPSWVAATAVQAGFTYTGGVAKFNKTEGEVLQGEIYVDGATVNNTIQQLVFAWRQDSGGGDGMGVQIDNISITSINCATPASFALAEDGRGTNSLTFDIEDENGSEWEIQYKPYEDEQWQSFFTTNLTGNVVDDLTSGTMYKIRVRAICGEDTSIFIPTTGTGYVLYSTECETITVTEDAPFVENFEGSAWFRSGNITSGDVDAPMCWLNINGKHTSYKWNRGTGATNSYNGSAGHLYMYNLSSVAADTTSDWFITPIFDLAGTETLSFFAKKGSVDETLKIMYYSVDENGDMTSRADTANFQLLQTITINSSDYIPYDIQLSDLVGQYRLAFYASAPGNNLRIDDVMVHIPNCSRPQVDDFSVVAAATTATVTITDESNSAWIIYYKAESESDYTEVPTTSQETQLTDLTATTTYNIYIVGDCGATQSDPSSSKTFRTRCFDEAISEFPYTEGFESGLDCWDVTYTSTNTSTYQWTAVTTGTYPTCTPHGGANMAKYQSCNASAGSTSTMISPLMDFPQNMTMKFWMYRTTSYASDNDHVEVYVNSLPTTEGATLLTTVQLNGPAAAWEEQEVQITEDNIGEQYIIFKAISGFGGNIYIDDITIDAAANCTRPDAASVAASAITANTATISWTDNNEDHSAWNVYYRVVGSEEDYSVAPASEQTVELTDLDPTTTYEVYVTTDCGSEESDATYSINFTTSCVTVVDFPYFEGFENGLTCWSIVNITGSEQWTQSNGSNMSSNSGIAPMTDGGGQYFAETHGTTRGNVNRFISPIFDISMLDTPVLSFYHLQKAWVSDIDNLKVYYKADLSDDWTQIANYTEGISTWRRDTIILPNPSETYQLAFEANLDYGYGVCIDNVSIYESAGEQPEPCDAPTALTVSNITQTSADFTWNGTATNYEVRLNENAAETVTTTSKSFTDLTANTTYTAYVRAVCENDNSEWVSTTFTTLEAEPVIVPPTVATLTATGVTHESATLNGTITAGSETITAQGFMYKATAAADWTNVAATGETMSATINGLTAETAYEFKAFATTASGTVEGTVMTFTTTAAPIVAPTVTTLAATSVTHNSATLNGTITAGDETITAQGFMYKATAAADWTTVAATGTTITSTLNNLTAETEYQFKAFATTASGTVEGTVMTFTTTAAPIVAPTVATLAATVVTHNSATLNGTITAGSETILAQGFMYKATAAADWTNVSASGTTLVVTVNTLTAETEYQFKAFATTASGTVEGAVMTFTTTAIPVIVPPTVTTLAATSVTHESATLNGTIAAGDETITAQGFMYKATVATDWTTVSATGTTITSTLNSLSAETEYQFKAFATTASGTVEGAAMTFTTTAIPIVPPTVTTLAATGVTHESATLNGTIAAGNETITAQGFMYKATAAADWTSVSASGTTLVATVNTLAAETEYQFKAFATTASGTVEGAVMTFTTTAIPIVPPTVTTLAATDVTHESATLNGTIAAGNETITAQGFMYKATAATDWTSVSASGTTLVAIVNTLAAETEYQFKAFATTASGTVEGAVMTFTTTATPVIVPPTVTTLAATSVTHESATLNGTIAAGDETITAQGFMYKATAAADWTTVAATGTTITSTLNSLAAETEYQFKAFATTASGTVEGAVMTFTTTATPVIVPPTVTTLAATSVTHESATLNGTIAAGDETITAQGFMYKATAATDWTTVAATGTTITLTLNSLSAETEYQFKAFATTASGTVEGAAMTFTTLATPIVAPSVATLPATGVTHEVATLNGTVTTGSEAITAQGFMYKATAAADWTTVAATGETMSATINGLTAETAYEYKAFATTASGTVEGTVVNFTTLAAPATQPTVVTLEATEITHEAATLNGTVTTGSEAITAQGFMYKATTAADWTTVAAEGTAITATINGLTPETEYEYKAFATTESGTVEGNVVLFTTLANSGLNSAEGAVATMTVYPNPASERAIIAVSGVESGAKIVVSDMQGRIILTDTMAADTYELSVENLASGVYYIRVIDGVSIHTQKLIVK